jgi:hypothetical protein
VLALLVNEANAVGRNRTYTINPRAISLRRAFLIDSALGRFLALTDATQFFYVDNFKNLGADLLNHTTSTRFKSLAFRLLKAP